MRPFLKIMNLGQAIKTARTEKGFSQSDLANLCQISVSYLSVVENNQKEPSLEFLRNLSEKLAIPVPVLFFLAMDEQDIPAQKREAFGMIRPSVQAMISEFFLKSN